MKNRDAAILDYLGREAQLTVHELAARLAVSEITVRRDLTRLQHRGLLLRTHGGAVPAAKAASFPGNFPMPPRETRLAAIGRAAADLVQPGQTVMIDTGNTALEVARYLPAEAGIMVVTTSLCVAEELYGSPITVTLLGGILRTEFPSLYGPLTETMLRSLHVDIVFMGCDGAHSTDGFYTSDLHLSNLEHAMIRAADRAVVVTESGKFTQRAFACYATPQEIAVVVSDTGLPPADRANLEECGVIVRLVDC
ncbi:MAG: DeoR/GlpR family DNA-binding transcription regulator [Armatimonadota bacterium]